MVDALRRRRLLHGDDVAERHHPPGAGADLILRDVRRVRAELLIRLHVDAIRTAVEVEVVDVGRSHQNLHRVGDVAERHAEALRLLAIDVDHQLRIVRGELREERRQAGRLVALRDDLLRRRFEVLDRPAALIEQLVGEAAEHAEPLDRRRQERNHHRAGNLAERAEQLPDDRLRRVRLAAAFVEVLQLREDNALVRRGAGEAESARGEHRLGGADLHHDLLGLLARCSSCSRATRPAAPE